MVALLMLQFGTYAQAASVTVVNEAQVRQGLVDYVKNRTAALGLDVSVKKIGYSGDMNLPAGTVSYEVMAPQQWEGWGSANLALIVRVDDRVVRNLPVRVEVEALSEMVVAVRPLERGEVIAAGDIALQKRDLAAVSGKICRSLVEVIGKRLKASQRGNSPLRADTLEKVPLVKSGQLVTVLLENEVLKVTTTGRVKSAGAEGDTVLVQNTGSQKDVPARVVNASTVMIEF